MKPYYFYLIALALIVLSACAQKRPVSMPQSHLPPESVPEIGGPVTDQSTVPDDSTVAGRGRGPESAFVCCAPCSASPAHGVDPDD